MYCRGTRLPRSVNCATGNSMIAFDTNIAIYVVNGHPEFVDQAVKVIERAEVEGCSLSAMLITEVLSFPPPGQLDSIAEMDQYLQSFQNTVYVSYTEQIARRAASILRQYRSLRLADSIHLATAAESGAHEFWTNDHRLEKVHLPGTKIRLLSEIT